MVYLGAIMAALAGSVNGSPTYLVAKYVPNLDRGEPRNIGVILWTKGRVAMRFATVSELDFVNDVETFDRWVSYWKRLTDRPTVQIRNRRPVAITSSRYLRELQVTQNGNYLLEEGGAIVDQVSPARFEDAADFLFERLVAKGSRVREGAENFRERCDDLLAKTGVSSRCGFTKDYRLNVNVGDTTPKFRFHYGIEREGGVQSLIQRIGSVNQTSATSISYMFEWARNLCQLPVSNCLSLIESSGDSPSEFAKLLEQNSQVINLADESRATEYLTEWGL